MANKVIVTSLATLNAALAAAATNSTTCISIELAAGDTLNTPSPIVLPPTLGNASKKLIIEGNGTRIRPATVAGIPGQSLMMRKNPALDSKACSFIIRNLEFDGRGLTTSGLELCNSTDSIIENCLFYDVVNGLVLRNDYNTTVNNCSVVNHSGNAFETNYGNWVGATPVTTRTSNVTFNGCRHSGFSSSSSYGWYLNVTPGVSMNNSISEGNVLTTVYFDSLGYSSVGLPSAGFAVNNFNITNISIASIGSNGYGIRLRLVDGYAKISGLHTNAPGVLIYADAYAVAGASNPHLYVENIPYLDGATKFQTVGGIVIGCPVPEPSDVVVWEFKEVYDGNTIFGAARWIGGYIPYHRYAEYFQESKKITTNSITVNGNPI